MKLTSNAEITFSLKSMCFGNWTLHGSFLFLDLSVALSQLRHYPQSPISCWTETELSRLSDHEEVSARSSLTGFPKRAPCSQNRTGSNRAEFQHLSVTPGVACWTCPHGKHLTVLVGMSLSCVNCMVEVSPIPEGGTGKYIERKLMKPEQALKPSSV